MFQLIIASNPQSTVHSAVYANRMHCNSRQCRKWAGVLLSYLPAIWLSPVGSPFVYLALTLLASLCRFNPTVSQCIGSSFNRQSTDYLFSGRSFKANYLLLDFFVLFFLLKRRRNRQCPSMSLSKLETDTLKSVCTAL